MLYKNALCIAWQCFVMESSKCAVERACSLRCKSEKRHKADCSAQQNENVFDVKSHYENIPMQYTVIFKVVKNEYFFFIFCSYYCSNHRL